MARLLLKHRANVNATDNWRWTPLHEACVKNKLDTVLVLLKNSADMTLRNSEKKTAYDLCEAAGNVQLGQVLTGEYRKSELFEACRTGNEELLERILTPLNVNCFATDGRKSTPLHLAAGYNRLRIVKSLLEYGANVHARDKGGLIPLHNACSYGHLEVAKLLIEVNFNSNRAAQRSCV